MVIVLDIMGNLVRLSNPEHWRRAVKSGSLTRTTSILVESRGDDVREVLAGEVCELAALLEEFDPLGIPELETPPAHGTNARAAESALGGVRAGSPPEAPAPSNAAEPLSDVDGQRLVDMAQTHGEMSALDAILAAETGDQVASTDVSGEVRDDSIEADELKGDRFSPAPAHWLVMVLAILLIVWILHNVVMNRPPAPTDQYIDRTANIRAEPRSDQHIQIAAVLERGEQLAGTVDPEHPDWFRISSAKGRGGYVKRAFVSASPPPTIDARTAGWRTLQPGTIVYPSAYAASLPGIQIPVIRRVYFAGFTASGMAEVIIDNQIRYISKVDVH